MRRHTLVPLLSVALALVLGGCASAGSSGTRSSSSRLTAEEIAEVGALTAYEVIEIARPRWLTARTLRAGQSEAMGTERAGPVVYVDMVRVGHLEELRRLRADIIALMQYMSPSDATNRFGTNHDSGAILVTTR